MEIRLDMRLDLFLKASRLSPRRTVAQKLCDAGLVLVNNHVAKSAHTIKAGDVITLRRGKHETSVKVLSIPDVRQTSRKDAASLYELISKTMVEEL
jgi:ribosomal 50S subunit-recycling heat shock protein